jgi:hypothetical protein
MRLRLFLLNIAFLVGVQCAYGAESDADRVLEEFCSEGLARNRGIVHTPFAGPIDHWLLQKIAQDKRFEQEIIKGCKALDIEIPEKPVKPSDLGKAVAKKSRNAVVTDLDHKEGDFRGVLEDSLNGAVGKILPEIYLRLDGLSALRRYQFIDSLEISEEQQQELKLLIDAFVDRARDYHKAIFSYQRGRPTLREFEDELRLLSSELDKQILKTLNEEQKQKLAQIVEREKKLGVLLEGPGAY